MLILIALAACWISWASCGHLEAVPPVERDVETVRHACRGQQLLRLCDVLRALRDRGVRGWVLRREWRVVAQDGLAVHQTLHQSGRLTANASAWRISFLSNGAWSVRMWTSRWAVDLTAMIFTLCPPVSSACPVDAENWLHDVDRPALQREDLRLLVRVVLHRVAVEDREALLPVGRVLGELNPGLTVEARHLPRPGPDERIRVLARVVVGLRQDHGVVVVRADDVREVPVRRQQRRRPRCVVGRARRRRGPGRRRTRTGVRRPCSPVALRLQRGHDVVGGQRRGPVVEHDALADLERPCEASAFGVQLSASTGESLRLASDQVRYCRSAPASRGRPRRPSSAGSHPPRATARRSSPSHPS